jgi:hypothetical protein
MSLMPLLQYEVAVTEMLPSSPGFLISFSASLLRLSPFPLLLYAGGWCGKYVEVRGRRNQYVQNATQSVGFKQELHKAPYVRISLPGPA